MHNFEPGDIVTYRWGAHSEPVSIVLLDIVEHESGPCRSATGSR